MPQSTWWKHINTIYSLKLIWKKDIVDVQNGYAHGHHTTFKGLDAFEGMDISTQHEFQTSNQVKGCGKFSKVDD